MMIANYANLPYEYNWFIRLLKKGNPIENRPIAEYSGMLNTAINMSVLGMSDKVEMETEEEKGERAKADFESLPEHIKEKFRLSDG